MLPLLISLNSCCNILIVGPEINVNNMKIRVYPSINEHFKLLVVVLVLDLVFVQGIFFWYPLEPFVPIKYRSNGTPYLGIVNDHMPQLMSMVHPSCDKPFRQDNGLIVSGNNKMGSTKQK